MYDPALQCFQVPAAESSALGFSASVRGCAFAAQAARFALHVNITPEMADMAARKMEYVVKEWAAK